MSRILIVGGTIITINPNREVFDDGAILIEDGRIARIGASRQFDGVQVDELIDATGQAVMPGFVNAHTHTAYYMMRTIGMDRDLLDWLKQMVWPWLMVFEEEDAYSASLLGYLECLKSGTTSLVDNQNFPVENNHFYDAAGRAALKSRLRVTFAPGFSDIAFASPKEMVYSSVKGIEKECKRMIKTWHGRERIRVSISPINLLFCSDESIEMAVSLANETGVAIHTHVAESRREHEALKERFGVGYIEAFYRLAALNRRFQSVHSVWVSDDEIDRIAEAGAHVMHNPTSNMVLGSGIAPITKMLQRGVNVALGTDSPNNNNDMLESMKFAALLQKVHHLDPTALKAEDVLEMATINGARALGMENEIGSLEVGKLADITIINLRSERTTPCIDPVSALVYSAQGSDVTHVLVEGEFLVRDGKAQHLNEKDLIAGVQARAEAVAVRAKDWYERKSG